MLKRILFVLLVLISVPFCSFAEGMELDFQITEYDCTPAEEIVPLSGVCLEEGEELLVKESSGITLFSNMTFEEYIVDKVMNATDQLPTVFDNLGQFNISKDDIESVYFNVVLRNPQLLLKTAYRYWHYENIVQKIEPVFVVDSLEEAEECRLIMKEKVREYTTFAADYDTDLEKLLEIHDKMVAETDYDVRVMNTATAAEAPVSVYHAIGVFRDNLAVCQGYSQALFTIAQALDIETGFCYSEEKNHMWNYVKLDGEWYNLDVTNDDPIEIDENGAPVAGRDPRAYHRYFLISDDNLNGTIHGADRRSMCGEEHPCKNKKYESGYIFNVATPVSFARKTDGMFHALIDVYGGGVAEQKLDFKSKSLRTGAAIVSLYVKNNNLYYSVYPTRNMSDALFMYCADNSRKTKSYPQLFNYEKNKISTINFGSNLPDSLTTFLWDSKTMAPIAQKSVWSKPAAVEDEGAYGIILAAGEGSGLSASFAVEVVLADGESGTYSLRDKVSYVTTRGVKSTMDAEDVYNMLTAKLQYPTVNRASATAFRALNAADVTDLAYRIVTENGKITTIKEIAAGAGASGDNKKFDAENMRYGSVFFDEETVVASISLAANARYVKSSDVILGKVTDFFVDGEGSDDIVLYNYDMDNDNISGFVIGTDLTSIISQKQAAFVVASYKETEVDGYPVYEVVGFQGGKEVVYNFSTEKGGVRAADFGVGNVVLPSVVSTDGMVYEAKVLFDYDSANGIKIKAADTLTGLAKDEEEFYYYGKLDTTVKPQAGYFFIDDNDASFEQLLDKNGDHAYVPEEGIIMLNSANYTLVDFSEGDVVLSKKSKGTDLFTGYGADYNYEVLARYYDEELVDLVVYKTSISGQRVATPQISFANGFATITCATPGAEIYYSIDGRAVQEYVGAFAVQDGETVEAWAVCDGYLESRVALDVAPAEVVVEEGTYGIILAAGEGSGLSASFAVEVVLADGESGTYSLRDKVSYVTTRGVKSTVDAEDVYNMLTAKLDYPTVNRASATAFRALNAADLTDLAFKIEIRDGKITAIKEIAAGAGVSGDNKEFNAENMRYGSVFFDEETVVASVTLATNARYVKSSDVILGKVTDFFVDGVGSDKITLYNYDLDSNGISGFVIGTDLTSIISQKQAAFIVHHYYITEIDGYDAYVVTGLQGGEEKTYTFSTEKIYIPSSNFRTGNVILPGVVNVEGMAFNLAVLFDCHTQTVNPNIGNCEGEYCYYGNLDETKGVTSSKFFLEIYSEEIDDLVHSYNDDDGVVMYNSATYTCVDFSQGISPENVEISRKAKGLSLFSGYASNYDYEVFVRYFDEELADVVVYRYAQPVA